MQLHDLRRSPNALAPHYSRFDVGGRILLSGHSHQAWPDVAREGVLEAFDDAARAVDEKWGRALARAERVKQGFRELLDDPGGEIALAASTHELVTRWLSALPLADRPRLITTRGEYHSIRRQLTRLAETGIEVVAVEPDPVETLAERLAAEIAPRRRPAAAMMVSAVFFETARIVPQLERLAERCAERDVPLLVDAYHALGAMPFSLRERGLGSALVTGGGYKYLQLGEGNCFLRLPPGLDLRPVNTGWFAEFATMTSGKSWERVEYGSGAAAFGGATYDPTSHYRAARVLDFFRERALSPAFLREVSQHQVRRLAEGFDALRIPETIVRRPAVELSSLGAFLALESPRARELANALAERGVLCDARRSWLRLGPAPYLSDSQLDRGVEILGEAAAAMR